MLRTVFKAWHDEAMVTRIENHLDKKLLSRSFSYWMLRQRGRLLERVRDHRFQQEAFDIWRERFEGIRGALDSWGEQLQKGNSAKIAKCFFQMWVQKLRDRDDEYEVAIVYSDLRLLLIDRYAMRSSFFASPSDVGETLWKVVSDCLKKRTMPITTSLLDGR